MSACDDVARYFDGELRPDEETPFLSHLAECARCQEELETLLQLAAAAPPPLARVPATTRALATRPASMARRRWRVAAGATILAAAAALALLVGRLRHAGPEPTLLALGPQRPIEARLSYAAADRYRPYDVARAARAPAPLPPLRTLARLEESGDLHGVAVAYLLAGDRERAATYLARAQRSLDVDAELGTIALLRGNTGDALARLDDVLARAPRLGAGWWNRALALQRLGLTLAAAQAFDRVAALDEPGWRDEAAQRSRALKAEVEARHRQWLDVDQAGRKMVLDGAPIPVALALQQPGLARLHFYDAVRVARSRAELLRLRPLAVALDETAASDGRLARLVDSIGAGNWTRRLALQAPYRRLVAGATLPPDERDRWLGELAASGVPDLLLGALLRTQQAAAQSARYTAAARATGDPWFLALAGEQRARADALAGDASAAERHLADTLAHCTGSNIEYRCALVGYALANLYLMQHRVPDARRVGSAALARARAIADWGIEFKLLYILGETEHFGGNASLTRAYFDELILREPDDCTMRASYHETMAWLAIERNRIPEARTWLESDTRCPGLPRPTALEDRVDLARAGERSVDVPALRRDLAQLRDSPQTTPGSRALMDWMEGRLVIDGDRDTGRQLLRRAIEAARRLPADAEAQRASAYSFMTLIDDAARRDEGAAALALFAEEMQVPARDRCLLGAAVDNDRVTVLARDAHGQLLRRYETHYDTHALDVATLVPREMAAALRGCAEVAVLARPPLQGRGTLLPPDIAWSYRLSHAPAAPGRLPPRRLVVSDVTPAPSLELAPLGAWRTPDSDGDGVRVQLSGPSATPTRVLAAMRDATEIELHAHGLVDLAVSDASFLALSPEADDRFALSAGDVRRQQLRGAPLVLLVACHAADVTPYYHEAWSLPLAFLQAGARAVIAATTAIPDATAAAVFGEARRRIEHGQSPATALRDIRAAHAGTPAAAWVNEVLVFE